MEDKKKQQQDQEKRQSFKRKLEAEALNVRRNIARTTAKSNEAVSVSTMRLREIDAQIAKL
jgi:hypothetical protein